MFVVGSSCHRHKQQGKAQTLPSGQLHRQFFRPDPTAPHTTALRHAPFPRLVLLTLINSLSLEKILNVSLSLSLSLSQSQLITVSKQQRQILWLKAHECQDTSNRTSSKTGHYHNKDLIISERCYQAPNGYYCTVMINTWLRLTALFFQHYRVLAGCSGGTDNRPYLHLTF